MHTHTHAIYKNKASLSAVHTPFRFAPLLHPPSRYSVIRYGGNDHKAETLNVQRTVTTEKKFN